MPIDLPFLHLRALRCKNIRERKESCHLIFTSSLFGVEDVQRSSWVYWELARRIESGRVVEVVEEGDREEGEK